MSFRTTLSRNDGPEVRGKRQQLRAKAAQRWHALKGPFVTRFLEVNPLQGLNASDVAARRLCYGSNTCETIGRKRLTGMLLLLLLSIVLGFMLTAAILNSAVRDNMEALALLAIAVIGAVVGFVHVLKAARALDAIHDATMSSVQVRREGHKTKIKAEDLVPGDIVIFCAGDHVPADARLIEAVQLRARESALTGKDAAVEKRTLEVDPDAPLDQRQSMVYLGTTIGSGSAVAAVVATGLETELGKKAACDN